MAEVIEMPLMSDTMTEGVIAEWHKNVGDTIEGGDLLAEIETDKATMEFEAPEDGILLYRADANAPIPVNSLLAIIGEKDEDISAIITQYSNKKTDNTNNLEEAPVNTTATPAIAASTSVSNSSDNNGRVKASPLAKRLAADNNIDLQQVKGSGDEGRIIKRDIEALLAQPIVAQTEPVVAAVTAPPSPQVMPAQGDYEDVRVSQMRKTIARRLSESKFGAPHFYLRMEVNMDKAMASRKLLNEFAAPNKISFNDIIVKAAAMALRQHPAINSSWLGDTIRKNKTINIGVAVAVDEGLLVPVIANADNKSLTQIGTETRSLAGKARDKKLQPNEMQGNTFTISNLGMFDIDEFTAIINPPDACILAVGKISKVPAIVNDEVKAVNIMKLTLSCDHRVVDGVTGAKFLQTLKGLLQDPMRMLV